MSDFLQEERALLLHPETENFNPFNYFKFNEVGRFLPNQPKTSFEYRQAKETIDIIRLNRDKLFSNYRKKKIREIFKKELKKYLSNVLNKEIKEEYFYKQIFEVLDRIKENSKPHQEYSFFWSFIYKNFDFFIKNYFKVKYQTPFIKLHKQHLEKNKK